METVNQETKNIGSGDEQRVEQQMGHSELKVDEPRAKRLAWQRPVLKVLPIERARKGFGPFTDGSFATTS